MSHTFNLSVKDYDIKELKDLLNLKEPYTLEDIVNNQTELQEKLLMDGGISTDKKNEIITFLEEAKNILIKNSKKEFEELTKETPDSLRTVNLINSVRRDKIADKTENINITTKLVSFDSRFRDNYFETLSTDYVVTLPTILKNVVSVELGSIEIPSTFYQISKQLNNDYFWIEYETLDNDPDIGNEIDVGLYYIDIPEGNYNRENMQNAINTSIQKALGISNVNLILNNIPKEIPKCQIKPKTGKTLIAINDTTDTRIFNIHFNKQRYTERKGYNIGIVNSSYNLVKNQTDYGIIGGFGWILGYRSASYVNDNSNKTASYTSEGCYDGWGSKYLYLVIDDFNKNSNSLSVTNFNASLGPANVLARIPTDSISSDSFKRGSIMQKSLLKDDYTYRKRDYFGPVDITKIGIRLIDDIGRTINLNNMDFSFALNVNCLYDEFN